MSNEKDDKNPPLDPTGDVVDRRAGRDVARDQFVDRAADARIVGHGCSRRSIRARRAAEARAVRLRTVPGAIPSASAVMAMSQSSR